MVGYVSAPPRVTPALSGVQGNGTVLARLLWTPAQGRGDSRGNDGRRRRAEIRVPTRPCRRWKSAHDDEGGRGVRGDRSAGNPLRPAEKPMDGRPGKTGLQPVLAVITPCLRADRNSGYSGRLAK